MNQQRSYQAMARMPLHKVIEKYFGGNELKASIWIREAIKIFGYDLEGCWNEEAFKKTTLGGGNGLGGRTVLNI